MRGIFIILAALTAAWPASGAADNSTNAPVSSAAPWQRDSQPLLANFNNMYSPCVVEVRGEWRYRMWFFGWAGAYANADLGITGCDAIFHARSRDLKTWQVYARDGAWDATMNPKLWAAVLSASTRWYDCWHNGDPSVVCKDGKFFMAYSATSKDFGPVAGFPAAMVQCVMGATSEDGIHWAKTETPLLIRAGDSAKPRPEPDRIGDFHRPCLRWEDGRWRLWFDYWLPGQGVCMGYSESSGDFAPSGGFRIRHDLKQPLLADWPNPEIIKIGRTYHAFADPSGYPIKPGASPWMSRQLREAISEDGLRWTRLAFIPPDPDADACHVPQALLTTIDGQPWLYLFYATQIGYGRKDGQYHYEYDRIRAMRRPCP